VRYNFLLRVASGMGAQFRASADHAKDIAAVVALPHRRDAVPVWLVGISRGSSSAANGAVAIGPPRIAGVVLTSSAWLGGMANVALRQIRIPVFVVHNRDDGCRESPFGDTEQMMDRISQTTVKQLLAVPGGALRSGPCDALSPHGYYGIED
jgi:hypothetical protein